jgi:putative ABC transport system permease protein
VNISRFQVSEVVTFEKSGREGITMSWIENVGQDARFAIRLLAKERWFTAASTAALALGIGVTSMMVTIINGYNFRGLPVPDPNRVVHIGTRDGSGRDRGVSYLDYQDIRRDSRSFASLAAFASGRITISEPGSSPETVGGAYLSADSFGILGTAAMLGRGLVASDDRPGASPVVILGQRLWTGRYGGDHGVLGRSVLINGAAATVVGVMPEGFEFPYREGVWLPLALLPGLETQPRDERGLDLFGRLADGAGADQARAELETITAALARAYPHTNDRVRPTVVRFGVQQVGRFGQDLPPLAILATAVFVLLIACANVANLLLARSAGRSWRAWCCPPLPARSDSGCRDSASDSSPNRSAGTSPTGCRFRSMDRCLRWWPRSVPSRRCCSASLRRSPSRRPRWAAR